MGRVQLHYEVECAAGAPRWLNVGRWVALLGAAGTWVALTALFAQDGLPFGGACVGLPAAGLGWWLAGWWWRLTSNALRWGRALELRFDGQEAAWRRGRGAWRAVRGELRQRADGALVDQTPDGEAVLGWDYHGPRIFEQVLDGWRAVRHTGASAAAVAKVDVLPMRELPERVKASASIDGVTMVLSPFTELSWMDRLFALLMPLGLLGGPPLAAWVLIEEGWPIASAIGLAVPLGVVFGLIGVMMALLAALLLALVFLVPTAIVGLDLLPDAELTLSATRLMQRVRKRKQHWDLADNPATVWLRPDRSWGVLVIGPAGAEREVLKGPAPAVLWLGNELNQLRALGVGAPEDVPDSLQRLREGANRRTTR